MTFAELLLNSPYTPPKGRTRSVRNLNMTATPTEIEEREIAIVKALHPIQWRSAGEIAEKLGHTRSAIAQALRLMAMRGDVEIKKADPERLRSEVRYRRKK